MARKRRPPPKVRKSDVSSLQASLRHAVALHQRGKLADAERIYADALQQQPDNFDAMHLLGVIALQTQQTNRGVELVSKAIELNPKSAPAYSNLGNGLKDLKRHDEALASYDKAIELKADFAEVYNNRGIVLQELKRREDALASYDRAISLRPDYAEAYNNRGNVLRELARPEDALASCDKAIALRPELAEAYSNRGTTLRELKRPEDALASYDQAIALNPEYADAHWNRSLCLLMTGRFEEGWKQYEWRTKCEDFAARPYPQPLWSGEEDIAGKILFIYWEQGLGDTIQFCRYAKLAEARGAKVVLSVQDPLRRLLKQLSPTIQVVRGKQQPAEFDYHSPMLSLPLAFATTSESIPAEIPYLRAEKQRIETWKQRLGDSGFRVGICWQGSTTGTIDIGRSYPLRELSGISAIPGVRLISLQKNDGIEQLASLPQGMKVETLGEDFDSGPDAFLDTAAVMESLDLIITSDTAVAHLAGALGRPTWVALKHVPNWRWLLEGSESAWYPSLRLFRQKARGDWKSVFDQMRGELNIKAVSGQASQAPDEAIAHYNRGNALRELKRLEDALASYDMAITLKPDHAAAHNNRGSVLRELTRHEDALASFEKAIALKRDDASAHYNYGNALRDLNRTEDALASYHRAIELRPGFAEAYNNRGTALQELQRLGEALGSYEKAISLRPNYAEAHNNCGSALQELKRPEDALASYDRAIALNPEYARAHWNRSLCLLQVGRFEEGWKQYEWRKKKGDAKPTAARVYPQPLWSGEEEIAGKILFIYWEQGLGDTIQFCRYAKLAEARGARVVLSVQDPLRRLLKQLSPTIQVVRGKQQPADFDYHSPLLSLPLAFGTTSETIPAEIPYLHAEKQRVETWKRRLGDSGFRIGICWQGRKGKLDIGRSYPLRELSGISTIPGVRLFSLQKNEGAEQLAHLPEGMKVETLGEDFDPGPDAFLDTAAVMESLDLIITSDTAVAHLAGALGRPTWVALRHVPDWRWLLEGSKSAWYPSLRLFRQKARGDWKSVFDQMRKDLSIEAVPGARFQSRIVDR